MASDYDRWMFLLTVSALPLSCADESPVDAEGSTGTTEAPSVPVSTSSNSAEGSSSVATPDDTTGSSTAAVDSSTTGSASTSDSSSGTTIAVDPGSTGSTGLPGSSEGSSSGGVPGLCEQWATEFYGCYGYYSIPYLTSYCYDLVNIYTDPMCQPEAVMVISCEAFNGGPCMAMCDLQEDALDMCEDQVLADMLGCAMLPMIPGAGTIEAQCGGLATQATNCHNAGYYIAGFSQYVGYDPQYMIDFCTGGAYFTFLFPPPGIGDTCGGAYEDLLTCLSGLTCLELDETMIFQNHCTTEIDALTCRCELGA